MVELIYNTNCPNVAAAREQLRRALTRVGLPPQWKEWDQENAKNPHYVHHYGSPTILVDGQDIAGVSPSAEAGEARDHCRIYKSAPGDLSHAPSVETIVQALTPAPLRIHSLLRTSRGILPTLPASIISFIPVGLCPACWPAYAGLLGSIGLGFLLQLRYLVPLTISFLALAVAGLGYRARTRRGYGPLLLGTAAAVLVVAGKFFFTSDPIVYAGIGFLFGASLWNAWPKHSHGKAHCSVSSQSPEPQP